MSKSCKSEIRTIILLNSNLAYKPIQVREFWRRIADGEDY